ncbi:MAG: DUF3570 domain-containing protein [Myxococcales bacterium]|nr:DUF3570 domain-containing protein [Myxococcales bacterium]
MNSLHGRALGGLLLAVCVLLMPRPGIAEDQAAVATYVRRDSDRTLVVAPRLRLRTGVTEATHLNMVYAVDVWTSASIDIISSASPYPVTEQRDEVDLSVDHEFSDITVTAAYRYSREPDYVSHGGSGGFGYDFADNNSTIAVGISGSSDSVGRAGDPNFDRSASTFGSRLAFTQVLDVDTVAQGIYEYSRIGGYQSSPYRFVPIGGANCTEKMSKNAAMDVAVDPATGIPLDPAAAGVFQTQLASLCPPEHNPTLRQRHAMSARVRRSLGEALSAGLTYRFYLDDWGITSHTVTADMGYMLSERTMLGARYRFYTQGAADHYRSFYEIELPYLTRDKELSPLTGHRLVLELEHAIPFPDERKLVTSASVSPLLYFYPDFPLRERISGVEFNLALSLTL